MSWAKLKQNRLMWKIQNRKRCCLKNSIFPTMVQQQLCRLTYWRNHGKLFDLIYLHSKWNWIQMRDFQKRREKEHSNVNIVKDLINYFKNDCFQKCNCCTLEIIALAHSIVTNGKNCYLRHAYRLLYNFSRLELLHGSLLRIRAGYNLLYE